MNNVHIERSLSYAHREEMAREVRANRSATGLHEPRAPGSSGRMFPRFLSFALSRSA